MSFLALKKCLIGETKHFKSTLTLLRFNEMAFNSFRWTRPKEFGKNPNKISHIVILRKSSRNLLEPQRNEPKTQRF